MLGWESIPGLRGTRRALEQRAIQAIRNIYIWAHYIVPPPSACGYVNIHELHYDVGRIAIASCLTQNIDSRHLQVQWRDLTKVISILNWGPETDMSRSGIEPGPQWWEASTQAKRYLNSVLIAIRNIYIRVGNFRQKNNSPEDEIDGINGYFRRNSGCSAEQKILEFRSEPFRGRENNLEFRSVEQK